MNFVLSVHAAPYASQTGAQAVAFARELLRQGHEIERIFFYHEGVYQALASQVAETAAGTTLLKPTLLQQWQSLADQGVELAVCISSATKRGVVDEAQQTRHQLPATSLHPSFVLTGLGQLIAAIEAADRYIEFPA